MSSIEEQTATQVANLERATGRSMDAWIEIVRASGLEKHGEMVAMLKRDHGIGHGNANLVAIRAREATSGGPASDADLLAAQYAGRHAALRPLYDTLIDRVRAFGPDVELAPKKAYVSLRRRKQFGQVGPAAGQLEVCVNLPGVEPTERLRATSGMATHRVRISGPEELDDELVDWLRQAYERA